MTLRGRIIVSFFLPAVLLTVIGGGTFLWFSSITVKEEVFNNLVSTSYSRAAHLESYLAAVQGRVIDFTSDGRIRECISAMSAGGGCDSTELSAHLRDNKLPVYENMMEVLVLDARGTVIGSTVTEYIDTDLSQDKVYTAGSIKPWVTELYYSDTVGQIVFRVAAPVIDGNELQGLVVVTFLTDDLYAIVQGTRGLGDTGEIYLVGPGNIMLSPSRLDATSALSETVNTPNTRECFQDMRDYTDESGEEVEDHDEPFQIYPNYRNVTVLGTHAYIMSKSWCLIAEIDEHEALAPVRELSLFILVDSLFIIMCGYIIARIIGRIISRPIVKMKDGIDLMRQGHLDIKVGSAAPDEIGALGRAFDELASQFEKTRTPSSDRDTKGKHDRPR